MKKLLVLLALAPLMAFAKTSTPEGFTDDLDAAFAAAKTGGKFVLVCFSGSDWCGWCKRLEKEVFSHKEFIDATTNDFELVYIDNPANEAVLSEHAKKNNKKITEQYDINGFPTVLIFTNEGDKIFTTGYEQGGPEPYAKKLMELRKDADGFKRRAQAEKEFIGPFKAREKAIMESLRNEIMELQKVPVAKARKNFNELVKEFEAAKVPEGLGEKRDEFLEELHEMQHQFNRED